MEGTTSIAEARKIMGNNFIGPDEIISISDKFELKIPVNIHEIQYSVDDLNQKKEDYLLILGVSELSDGSHMNISNLRKLFGIDPDEYEPCFYNQDWYLKESFITETLVARWYLIRKNVINESRAQNPDSLTDMKFPSAVLCAYTFFVFWFCKNEFLWKHDFIWCSDLDHNGDRIYVGKYNDVSEVNKNGFSIHRHLRIRDFYGAIDCF